MFCVVGHANSLCGQILFSSIWSATGTSYNLNIVDVCVALSLSCGSTLWPAHLYQSYAPRSNYNELLVHKQFICQLNLNVLLCGDISLTFDQNKQIFKAVQESKRMLQ